MSYQVERTGLNVRQIIPIVEGGSETADRIRQQRCRSCDNPIGVKQPFRSCSGGTFIHIVCP